MDEVESYRGDGCCVDDEEDYKSGIDNSKDSCCGHGGNHGIVEEPTHKKDCQGEDGVFGEAESHCGGGYCADDDKDCESNVGNCTTHGLVTALYRSSPAHLLEHCPSSSPYIEHTRPCIQQGCHPFRQIPTRCAPGSHCMWYHTTCLPLELGHRPSSLHRSPSTGHQ